MIRNKKHLLGLLKLNEQQLREILSNLDQFYYENKKVKKDKDGNPRKDKEGKIIYRILYPSQGVLKEVQGLIKDRILDRFELPFFVQGGVKGRDNITNALLHKGNKYFFQTDIQKFFPSIRHSQVYHMLVSNGFSPDVASIITKLTTYKGRLPQGTPTSTSLANMVFGPIDAKLLNFCRQHDLTLSRYVDDITISGKKPFGELSKSIIGIITGYDYSISKKKTGYKIGPADVTGVSVHNNFLTTTFEFQDGLKQCKSDKTKAGKLLYRNRVASVGKRKRKSLFRD